MPKFSVIVPIYNVEQYLHRCIDSLIEQTLKDIEIILVDDGSPDNSPQICDEYAAKDERIKVIHKKNGGVSAARNDGLSIAKGEWVLFCDSDDWMEPEACEKMYTTGTKTDSDIVITDSYRVIGSKRIYSKLFKDEFVTDKKEDIKELIYSVFYQNFCSFIYTKENTTGYGGPWNKAVKRELLMKNKIQFDTSVHGVFDDRLYAVNAYINAGKIAYIHYPSYNYVYVKTSITKAYKKDILQINEDVFKAFKNYLDKYNFGNDKQRLFDIIVIQRLKEALALTYFNVNHPDGLLKCGAAVGKLIKTEPYRHALKNVDANKLQKLHKITVKFLKSKMILPLGMMYYAYAKR
ncbi:MAG: glycosyltransferase family 2 protein [Clostridiales bacterium]|nr:glycosyltransferase family 2 protein [Clostridiales bacterium]